MKILSLDSSALVASVALCEDENLLAEYTLNNKNTHSQALLPMIEEMLRALSLEVSDIDVLAASAGPGSFTGVRIGAATLKGLAFALGKDCVEVSSLEALAFNLSGNNGLVCPVMNARRSQVYTALFRCENGQMTRLLPDSAMSISELDELLSSYEEGVYFCGDGYDITVEALKKTKALYVAPRQRLQSAYSVAAVAAIQKNQGCTVSDESFRVNYLRPSQAERERAEKEKASAN